MNRNSAFVVLFALLSAFGWSQGPTRGELHVTVSWMDDNRVSLQALRVELLNGTAMYVDQAFTDDTGIARFFNMRPGAFRLKVTGMNVVESISGVFYIDPRENFHSEFLRVKYKPTHDEEENTSRIGSVSAAELNITEKARQEFEKGTTAFDHDHVDEAKKRFKHATEIYPQYAAAWNSLGVIAMQAGDEKYGAELFAKAVVADPQFAPAHVNRAKTMFGRPDYRAAEDELTKAVSTDPNNVTALSLLATAQLQNHEYEQAVANARKVHALMHIGFGGVHLVAGNALEVLQRPAEAVEEYRLYVAETPNGPNTERYRARIQQLSSQIH